MYDCYYIKVRLIFRDRGREECIFYMKDREMRDYEVLIREREKKKLKRYVNF